MTTDHYPSFSSSVHSPLLKVDDLSVYHYASSGTVRAVDGVSLEIGENEAIGLVGESGSGKTTLGQAIAHLIWPPTRIASGKILFRGNDLTGASQATLQAIRKNEIAVVFQDPSAYLNPLLRVGRQISEAIPELGSLPKTEVRAKVKRVLEMVRIQDPDHVVNNYPHQLSGGMKQRITIAMALVRNPRLIILDEPTSALDVTIQFEILKLLNDLKKELGVSFLFITHDLSVAANFCDRIYVMYAAKIAEYGSSTELFGDASHPYTKLLLASSLRTDVNQLELVEIPGAPPDLRDPPRGCRFAPRCPYAFDRCAEEPKLSRISKTHAAACWLVEEKPVV